MSVSGGPDIVQDGLVLYLDAGNPESSTSGSSAWYDISGNGITGTFLSGSIFSGSNMGTVVFDGSNDYVNCGTDSKITDLASGSNSSMTIGTWINPSSPRLIVAKSDNNLNAGWIFGIGNASSYTNVPVFTDILGGGNGRYSSSIAVNFNTWNYLTLVFRGTTGCEFYMNGNLSSTGTRPGGGTKTSDNAQPLYVGYNIYTDRTTNYFSGSISSVQLYNRALSPQEILQNFNAQRSRFGV